MAWRSLESITKNLAGCIKWESLPPPFEAEFQRIIETCLGELAQEIFNLEKRIHDLERRGR